MKPKLTEKKLNKMLVNVWKGGFKVPVTKRENILEYHLNKIDSYKKQAWKAKYQRKIFGIADGDIVTLRSMINVILKVNDLRLSRSARLWKGGK